MHGDNYKNGLDEPVTDPSVDLPASHPLIKASKTFAAVLTLALIVLTPSVTRLYYAAVADRMLAEDSREVVEGKVEAVEEHPRGRKIQYAFRAGDAAFTGNVVLAEERAAGYAEGSSIDVAYSVNMPSVHRPLVLLPGARPPQEPEDVLRTGVSILLLIGLILWGLSSWEHVYLASRYAVAAGGIAWNQIAKIIFNGLFILMLVLLINLVFAIVASQTTGVRYDAWPRQILTALGVLAALVFLAKSTPFSRGAHNGR